MSDFAFLERYAPSTLDDRLAQQRAHWERMRRKSLWRNLDRALTYAQAALDCERDLRRAGHGTKEELKELLVELRLFELAAMVAQHEQGVE